MGEIRYNFLNDRYVIFSPKRAKRPHIKYKIDKEHKDIFIYGMEKNTPSEIFAIRKSDSKKDTPGWKVRVIPNRYPAVENNNFEKKENFYISFNNYGYHEVVIETPDPKKRYKDFSLEEFSLVLEVFKIRLNSLYEKNGIEYVHIFKNCGFEAGASISHSHSQILALPYIPTQQKIIFSQFKKFYKNKNCCYLCEEIKYEIIKSKRVVFQNENFILYAPYASLYPFQLRIVPIKHLRNFGDIDKDLINSLAKIFKNAFLKLEKMEKDIPFNLFLVSSPKKNDNLFFHWYFEIVPRLNILGGFEYGCLDTINTIFPEEAVKILKEGNENI